MTSYPASRGYGDDGGGGGGGDQASWLSRAEQLPEGSRRKRLAGYLKAANELRVTYQQSAQDTWKSRGGPEFDGYGDAVPGGFPDAAAVKKGRDQMIVFPSYARKHIRRRPRVPRDQIDQASTAAPQSQDGAGANDAAYWREQWEAYEDDHAVVDVDVRGWLYTPHHGPMTRKQRIFVSLARQLAGLPNPPDPNAPSGASTPGRSGSPHPMHERMQAHNARKEEDAVAREAQAILQKGEAEADNASRGQYSEKPRKDADEDSIIDLRDSSSSSRRPSNASDTSRRQTAGDESPLKRATNNDAAGAVDPPIKAVQKRASWSQPADMSPAELSLANSNLMARLRPFMANPLAGVAISVFFYNDETSQQRTVYTDPNGHFTIRAPLEFVPTHVRILASGELSLTEEVIVTPAQGVSVISDIDDTIKHSAISSGAREIFRNAFIRKLDDLVIEGVQEMYSKLAERGAKFHYVSNSPWQLYPILTKYFELAGLPPGSFHLKQYTGMLQGIFEPVAERKKGTLDRLARDFPERLFLLFGDNGEADLEVYTDFVNENPGRVLGIFIRDVTSTASPGFFSYSQDPGSGVSSGGSPKDSPSRSPRFSPRSSPRLSPRLSPKLNPANYFGTASKRQSSIRNSAPFSLDEENDPELQAALRASLEEYENQQGRSAVRCSTYDRAIHETRDESNTTRPALPPRRSDPAAPQSQHAEPDLIDLSDEVPPARPTAAMKPSDLLKPSKSAADGEGRPMIPRKPSSMSIGGSKPPSPQPPRKPTALQGSSAGVPSGLHRGISNARSKTPPPKPRRSSTSVPTPVHAPQKETTKAEEPQGYIAAAEQKLTTAYNALPSVRDKLPGGWAANGAKRDVLPPPTLQQSAMANAATSAGRQPPAPPPPRRLKTAHPASGLVHTNTMPVRSSTAIGSGDVISPYSTRAQPSTVSSRSPRPSQTGRTGSYRSEQWDQQQQQQQQPQISRKEQMWRQRWLAASQTLKDKGVVLKSWKVGADIEGDVLRLMDEAVKRSGKDEIESAKTAKGP